MGLPWFLYIILYALVDEAFPIEWSSWLSEAENIVAFASAAFVLHNVQLLQDFSGILGHFLFQCVISTGAFAIAWARLRRPLEPFLPPPARITPGAKSAFRNLLRDRVLESAQRPGQAAPIVDGANAVQVRESRAGLGRGTLAPRRSLCLFVLFVLNLVFAFTAFTKDSILDSSYDFAGEVSMAFLCNGLFVCGIVSIISSGVLVSEWEGHTLDALRMTGLTPREIVRGKGAAALRVAALLIPFSIAGQFVAALLLPNADGSFRASGMAYLTMLLCVGLTLVVAMLASVLVRRTATAVALALALASAIIGGPAMVYGIFTTYVETVINGAYVVAAPRMQWLDYLSPFTAYLKSALQEATPLGYWITTLLVFPLVGLAVHELTVFYFRKYRFDAQ